MSNTVKYGYRPDLPSLRMNNGYTGVFLEFLCLSASTLASTDRERCFSVWFALNDQSEFGSGVVGFDIDELPWSREHFQADKDFLLAVVKGARNKLGWERWGEPTQESEDFMFECLDGFSAIVEAFVPEHIESEDEKEVWWRNGGAKPTEFALCPEHQIYLTRYRCIVCG